MNVIIYVRARETEQKIEQTDECHAFAKDNGFTVCGVYDDLKKALKRAAQDDIDYVIVTERSRISENNTMFHVMNIMLDMLDVNLICVNED